MRFFDFFSSFRLHSFPTHDDKEDPDCNHGNGGCHPIGAKAEQGIDKENNPRNKQDNSDGQTDLD